MPTVFKPRTLPVDISLLDLEEEISHTLVYIRAYPALSALVPQFEAVQQDWTPLFQQEQVLQRAAQAARVGIVVVDDELDDVAVSLSNTLLAEVGDKQRKDPRYLRYYKDPVSRLRRPVLGPQLDTMRQWVPSLLEAQSSAPVQACGQRLAGLVERADLAVAALGAAQQALTDFQTLGAKKAFVERVNALRLSAFGQIAELPHSHPELKLPADFAQRFFLRDSSDRKPTIAEVEQSVLQARARVERLEALLAKLVEEADEEARLAEEAEVREATRALEQAEKQRAEAQAKIEAARARLAQKKKNEV